MSDPAVAAAQRAWVERYGEHERLRTAEDSARDYGLGHLAIAAAREALAPLQELHKPVDYYDGDRGYEFACAECNTDWPCETAKLIYSTEELSDDRT